MPRHPTTCAILAAAHGITPAGTDGVEDSEPPLSHETHGEEDREEDQEADKEDEEEAPSVVLLEAFPSFGVVSSFRSVCSFYVFG